jgi:Glycosyl transferase family 2
MTRVLSVDIIVNNFNYAPFLEAAIDSALAQEHSPVRVIVVDDGSTDDSRALIASYRDRITPVFKDNGGQASALNAGFARSTADVVIFLDADDVLLPHAARVVVDLFTARPETVKVQYRMEVIDAEGRPTGVVKPPKHLPMPSGDVRAHELAFPFDLGWLPTSGNAFAAWALQRLLPIPEERFASAADWYLQHVTPLLGPVASSPEIGAQFRTHGANDYEPAGPVLDLDHVRKSVVYADATREQLQDVAARLGLAVPRRGIISVSDVANRMVSLRLDAERHPIADDTVFRLVVCGARAAGGRFDVSPVMRLMFLAWFAAAAVVPRRVVSGLAVRFLFVERRPRLNRVLGALHRDRPKRSAPRTRQLHRAKRDLPQRKPLVGGGREREIPGGIDQAPDRSHPDHGRERCRSQSRA